MIYVQDLTKGDLIIYEDENDKIEIEAFLYDEMFEMFEMFEIIKEIRTSKRRFYQKVTDIFTECNIDYNKSSEIANDFFTFT